MKKTKLHECLFNIPHWLALRGRAASKEGKGQKAVTRPDNLPTTGFLHSHLTPSEASPIKVGSREEGMDSATQSWDQGRRQHSQQGGTICVMSAGNAGRLQRGSVGEARNTQNSKWHCPGLVFHHVTQEPPESSHNCDPAMRRLCPQINRAWIFQLRELPILLSQARSPRYVGVLCT